jgi:hypothetical protein
VAEARLSFTEAKNFKILRLIGIVFIHPVFICRLFSKNCYRKERNTRLNWKLDCIAYLICRWSFVLRLRSLRIRDKP